MRPNKTKEQIIDAYESRGALKVVSGILVVGGTVLAITLPGSSARTLTTVVLTVSFVSAIIITLFAIRCPICDSMKTPEYLGNRIIGVKTGFFRCDTCNLSNAKVREYVDLLKRGVDIDKDAIARFNRREL